MQYDVFISHSSVDKATVARPLAEALQARGLSVWLDEEQLQVGDSIRRGIDKALSQSRFGVVILSPAYLDSEWTRKELDALFTKEKYQNKTILPISHQLSREAIETFSPMLADKITLSTEGDIDVLAGQIHGSVLALPTTQKIAISKGLRLRFPTTNWQWLIATTVAVAAIVVAVWLSNSDASSDKQHTVNINVGENTGSVSADTVHGDKTVNQTVINQAINPEALARQLVEQMGVATTEDLQAKDEEIKQLTHTISRLQQQPGDEYKQSALKKLAEKKPQEAAELLKQSLAERDKALKVQTTQMAEDWVDVGNIAYLNNTQEALEAYQQAVTLNPDNIEAWNKLGYIQKRLGNLGKARKTFEKVLELAGDNESWQAAAYGNLGVIYRVYGELDEAEKSYLKVLEINKNLGNKETESSLYSNLGNIYISRGELDKAEKFQLKSLAIDKARGHQEGIATQYNNLGMIYRMRGKLGKAEEFYLKALEINKNLGNKELDSSLYGNLGLIYLVRSELGEAEEFTLRSLKIHESLGDQEGMANQYGNLGLIYEAQGRLGKAEEFFLKSLKIDEALGRQQGMANQYGNLGNLYLAQGELNKAEEFNLKALKIDEALGRRESIAIQHGNLGNIYLTRKDIKTACQHWQTSVNLFKEIGAIPMMEQAQSAIDSYCSK